ncbi:MAG: gluconokinase, GntK/IdnK-type, partial [Polyangiales bacterium]
RTPDAAIKLLVIGISGSGKTTIGKLIASQLGWPFLDADDFHSSASIDKMSRSVPLTDADRKPWIDALITRLNEHPDASEVLACSALTAAIRARFTQETLAAVRFVYLKIDHDRALQRLNARQGHYAKAGLLQSQLATLEEPSDAIVVEADDTPAEDTAQRVLAQLPRSV